MKIVNLTPHDVRLGHESAWPIPPAIPGGVRVAAPLSPSPWPLDPEVRGLQSTEPASVDVGGYAIPIVSVTYGELVGLPPPEAGTIYLLSQIACAAARRLGRCDCFYPADVRRDARGEVTHAMALGVV